MEFDELSRQVDELSRQVIGCAIEVHRELGLLESCPSW